MSQRPPQGYGQPPQGGHYPPQPPQGWQPPPPQGYPLPQYQQPHQPQYGEPPQYPQRPPPKKRGGFGKFLLIALGTIVGLFVLLVTILSVRSPGSAGNTPTFTANATYTVPDVRELKKSPDQFKRQPIQFTGEVFRINESGGNTDLQMWVPVPGGSQFDREAVYVTYRGTVPGVYEKTVVTVFGVGDGTASGANALGGTISQPRIVATRIEAITATAVATATVRR